MPQIEVINAAWPAPVGVRAVTTTRVGGVSMDAYAGLNLGDHVGDDPAAVVANGNALVAELGLPSPPVWLSQVHGATVVAADPAQSGCAADALWTDRENVVCAVLTADCVPLVLASRCGERVAAVHVGWRGLAAGIVDNALSAIADAGADVCAWMGPAISQRGFEVGPEVVAQLAGDDAEALQFFAAGHGDRSMADLYGLLRLRLGRLGVEHVGGGDHCTYSEPDRFFSHRRDGRCGRMATLVWREPLEH